MKYQLICPKCKHEFSYNNGYYDENITRLGNEIHQIVLQLQEHRRLPWEKQKERTDWYFSTKKALTIKQKQLSELKAIRKVSDQQIHAMHFKIFKSFVEEEIGTERYRYLLELSEKELEAYKISGLMAHEYTRANYKNHPISINKL